MLSKYVLLLSLSSQSPVAASAFGLGHTAPATQVYQSIPAAVPVHQFFPAPVYHHPSHFAPQGHHTPSDFGLRYYAPAAIPPAAAAPVHQSFPPVPRLPAATQLGYNAGQVSPQMMKHAGHIPPYQSPPAAYTGHFPAYGGPPPPQLGYYADQVSPQMIKHAGPFPEYQSPPAAYAGHFPAYAGPSPLYGAPPVQVHAHY